MQVLHLLQPNKKGPQGPFFPVGNKPNDCLVAAATTAVATTTTAAAASTTTVATTAATATTSTTTEAAATCARRTSFHRASFVDDQTTATILLTVHATDRSLGLSIAGHFHKAEALGAAGVTFHHDLGASDGTVRGKCLLQVFITESVGQVAHVKFVAHKGLLKMTQNAMESI